MNYTRSQKVVIGAAPAIALAVSLALLAWSWGAAALPVDGSAVPFDVVAGRLRLFVEVSLVFSVPVTVLYLYIAAARSKDRGRRRTLWMVAIVLAGQIGQMAFFFSEVWPEPGRLGLKGRRDPPWQSGDGSQRQFYVAARGRRLGPITEAGLSELWRAGRIGPETLVWTEGLPAWQAASSVLPPQSPTGLEQPDRRPWEAAT